MMPVNLDPIQTGSVLRLALEGKSTKEINPHLIADSSTTVLLDGFSSSTEDIQVRRNKITRPKKDSNPHLIADSNPPENIRVGRKISDSAAV